MIFIDIAAWDPYMYLWNIGTDTKTEIILPSSLTIRHTLGQGYYRKTSGISRTKSQCFDVSCILLQLSSLNPLKPGVKLRMKM